MDETANSIAAAASHQDQVVEAPPNTTVLAASAFTPLGMLAYDDQPAVSIQLHPEFDPDYAKALIELRRAASGSMRPRPTPPSPPTPSPTIERG